MKKEEEEEASCDVTKMRNAGLPMVRSQTY